MVCPTSLQLKVHPSGVAADVPGTPDEFEAPASVYGRIGKRALDLTLVVSALPVAACIALPIATWNLIAFRDPRRVFFVQDRVGYRGRTFRMVKFRTMRDPSESASHSWFSGGDVARVTRFGRFLRNMHLDELPQLVNILKGDMHLVGPRPEMPDIHAWACTQVPDFSRRLAVRPGLTGLAQVTQGYTCASSECYERKLGIDLEYIDRLSFRADLGIVGRTVPWVLQGRGWSWKKGASATASTSVDSAPRRAATVTEPVSIPAALPRTAAVPVEIERVHTRTDVV